MRAKLGIGDTLAGRYKLLDILGVSPTRTAFRAFDLEVEVEVALWVMRPEFFPTDAARSGFVAAAEAAKEVTHRNLLRIFDAGIIVQGTSESVYTIQQLGTSAELEGRLAAGGKANRTTVLRYTKSLAAGLDQLHNKRLYHGWLMPTDVVEVARQVKLCGGGLFSSMSTQAALLDWGTHRRYLAPELVQSGTCSSASDWYSLGVIILELAIGEPAMNVSESLATLVATAPKQGEALALVLAPDPKERLTAALSLVAAVQRGWDDAGAPSAHASPVNLPEPAPDSNFAPTVSMGQSYIDEAISSKIAQHRAETSLMVSEVEQPTLHNGGGRRDTTEPNASATVEFEATDSPPKVALVDETFDDGVTPQRVPTPAGGFDEGVTKASVDVVPPGGFDEGVTKASVDVVPPGGFDEGVTKAVMDDPPGGFDEGVTKAVMDDPPGGFDEGATIATTGGPEGGFVDGETSRRTDTPPGGFDEGPTVHNATLPTPQSFDRGVNQPTEDIPGGFDEGVTAHVASRPLESFDHGPTIDVPQPAGGFDEGDTNEKARSGDFRQEETVAASGPVAGLPEYDLTLSSEMRRSDTEDDGPTIAEDTLPPGGFDEGATVIEVAPRPRLLALSMKPKPDSEAKTPKRKPYVPTVPKPVLRPLSSLAESVETPPDLGILAPPRQEEEQSSPRNLWLILSLLLVAGAGSVTLFLILTRGAADEVAAPIDAGRLDATSQAIAPAAREVVVLGPSCPERSVHIAELKLCVDAHESPGEGRQPQSGISLEDAREACTERKMRLCTDLEWQEACQGSEGQRWPYGAKYQAEICNTKGKTIAPSGAHPECRSSFGIVDMSGNIAEWVEEGEIRGGSALDRTRGRCSELRPKRGQQAAFSDVGFRCCADAIASPTPSD